MPSAMNGGHHRTEPSRKQQKPEDAAPKRMPEAAEAEDADGTTAPEVREVLSPEQLGTLELNRRRLELERRQLRELGVI